MKLISIISFAIFLSVDFFAQAPGEPFNPMTAIGAKGISPINHILFWNNPINVKYNQVYFSTDSLMVANLNSTTRIFDGYPSVAVSSLSLNFLGYLEVYKKYYWRVVEYDSINFTAGPIWNFKTIANPWLILFEDDFENISEEWRITNDGGSCVWGVVEPPYPNNYTLPSFAGKLLVADADECGNGSSTLSSARLDFDIGGEFLYDFQIEWDNDWNALENGDSAIVEMSTDFGFTWEPLRVFDENDVRNTHESVIIEKWMNLYGNSWIQCTLGGG